MKNIVIFGVPRAGKSTLANKIVDKFHYQVLRVDCIRGAFKDVFPELKIKSWTAIEHEKFQEFLARYFYRNIKQPRNQYNYVLEGCETHVADCDRLFHDENMIRYYLGMTKISPEQLATNIRKYDSEKDWTYGKSDDEILEYAKRCIEQSKINQKECEKYHIKFVETSMKREEVLEGLVEEIEKEIVGEPNGTNQ